MPDQLMDVLGDRRLLVLTGAGVSTDSGIPDYRGPGSPVRTPMTYQEFIREPDARQRYWARAHVGWSRMKTAEPNTSHLLLAQLAHEGRLTGLITQNVDGLHTRAGHPDVIDLHGRIDRVICLGCGRTTSRAELHERLAALNPGYEERIGEIAPDGDVVLDDTGDFRVAPCLACGGRLKPDVVFFGENVPKDRVARCYALVEEAEALVVLGSSLQVMSGLRFVRAARKRSIPVAIVNRGATRGDDLATLKLDAGCAETLSAAQLSWRSRTVSGSEASSRSTSSPISSATSVTT
ncbi:NAD-dependent protein deacetylase [Aeromicrobium sp. S22]|uniref:NAD-dependent protein deacetylase n=1 Tax=Aeromicrobium sp. S22 TaxID=2662029 RepID=UPI00129D4F68|nr:NAD-dependent protein deacetylase [Aeromicrobium sp. S22]MRK00055.1 NAD-dependent protein deacetylase [Aeromicrobium sp. S22]